MERITRVRVGLLMLVVVLILGFFSLRLYERQVLESDKNANNLTTFTTQTRIRAARGDLVDTNGNVLVTNRASYDLVFNHYVILNCGDPNDRLLELVQMCREKGIEYYDHFPVSKTWPFAYTLSDFSPAWQAYFRTFLLNRGDIDSDISANISLSTLAESLNINAAYLSTIFKREVGKTVTEYINNERMTLAAHLLETTNLQIQTVALHCGVLDVQYFSKMFKKYFGKTPKEYRGKQ